MDTDDVWVVQLSQDLHLSLEEDLLASAGKRPAEHDLNGYLLLGRLLHGLIDHALAAAVDFAEQVVAREGISGKGRSGGDAVRWDNQHSRGMRLFFSGRAGFI